MRSLKHSNRGNRTEERVHGSFVKYLLDCAVFPSQQRKPVPARQGPTTGALLGSDSAAATRMGPGSASAIRPGSEPLAPGQILLADGPGLLGEPARRGRRHRSQRTRKRMMQRWLRAAYRRKRIVKLPLLFRKLLVNVVALGFTTCAQTTSIRKIWSLRNCFEQS